jgi:hypothetical protein
VKKTFLFGVCIVIVRKVPGAKFFIPFAPLGRLSMSRSMITKLVGTHVVNGNGAKSVT